MEVGWQLDACHQYPVQAGDDHDTLSLQKKNWCPTVAEYYISSCMCIYIYIIVIVTVCAIRMFVQM